MKNKIKFVKYIVISAIILFVCIDNVSAGANPDYCNAAGTATFNFAVEPAIGITVTHDWTLDPICPGCSRKWNCEEGSYFLEFIITGSTECWWDWNSPEENYSNLIQTDGDEHAWLEGCWYVLKALPATNPSNWVPKPGSSTQAGRPFLPSPDGMGIGGLRYYITYQEATCQASGTYQFTVTVNANYICAMM